MTRKILAFAVAFTMTLPAFAIEPGQAVYTGGTSTSIHPGEAGTLDVASPGALIFKPISTASGASGAIEIPYAHMGNFQYTNDVIFHIGALPAVLVSLVKKRARNHFFTITYVDSANTTQIAIFQVPKQEPMVLLPILRARAPQVCGKQPVNAYGAANTCGGVLKH
jgi:hypothetical protein